ncbi:hypothetical protein SAMN05421505_108237 [Sinosporangium album]|uniref:Uncharacterized protein n=2 Tax=Sinosporangium album TaxID=504805 RepID=A0A1G7XKU5_9ACTN|nr:hypothetical protein SAMN05421505_108237 [Sinosporangium album]
MRRASVVCAAAALLASATPAVSAHAEPTNPPVAEAWQQSTSARLRADGSLSDVVALSSTDVWAVGQQEIWDVWQNRGVITRWDGASWSHVPIRNDATGAGHLRSVAAAGPGQMWTVGDGHDGQPYIAKGDAGGFDRVTVDDLRGGDWLGGVTAAQGKVVAVGSRDGKPLVLSGDGASWSLTPMKTKGVLYGVSVSAKGDGWTVGDTGSKPLIMRLSGGTWRSVRVPSIPGGYLRDVYVDSPKRVLAVGGVYRGPDDIAPLVLAWNGRRWSQVRVPDADAHLYGVTGDGKGRFWISGSDPSRPSEAFLMRYEHGKGKIIRGGPVAEGGTLRLQSVTAVPGSSGVWAVGHVVDQADRYTDVVKRFGGPTDR